MYKNFIIAWTYVVAVTGYFVSQIGSDGYDPNTLWNGITMITGVISLLTGLLMTPFVIYRLWRYAETRPEFIWLFKHQFYVWMAIAGGYIFKVSHTSWVSFLGLGVGLFFARMFVVLIVRDELDKLGLENIELNI